MDCTTQEIHYRWGNRRPPGQDVDMAIRRTRKSQTDSTVLRFVREKITEEYSITPENWMYFEMALIIVSMSVMMQLHKFTNMLLVVALFMIGEHMLMYCCCIALVFKAVYYCFRNEPAVNEYYVEYNEKHKHTDVGLVGFAMTMVGNWASDE